MVGVSLCVLISLQAGYLVCWEMHSGYERVNNNFANRFALRRFQDVNFSVRAHLTIVLE